MQTGFITGLVSGLDAQRKEQQYKLNERKARGQEIDLVQREARRVADNDALDEQQTMTQLMNPGLHPDSRAAIVQARLNRRQQAQSYLQSLQGDPDKAKDIKERYGDLTQLMAPSAISSGNMPKPTMDMNSILGFLDKSNTAIRGMGDENLKRAELARRRGIAQEVYGAPTSLVDTFLPEFGSKTGTIPGKVGDWQKIENIPGLPPELQQGGSIQQPNGMTLETGLQNGELMKRYKAPDTDIKETYQQPEVERLKIEKMKLDLPFIQERIKQLQAKTAAIPEEVKIKYGNYLEKIRNNKAKDALRQLAIGVQQEANGIRMWGLQRTHERGMASLGMRQAQFGLNVAKFDASEAARQIARLDRLGAALDKHIGAAAKGVTLGQPQIVQAEDAMAKALKTQIENAKAYLLNYQNDDYNDAFLDHELGTGGLQRPSRMMGMGAMGGMVGMGMPNPGDVTYNYGNYQGLTPQDMAAYMQRGLGYNTGMPSPIYGAGSAGVNPGAYVQSPVAGAPQTRMVTMSPSGYIAVGPQGSQKKINIKPDKAVNPLIDYASQADKKGK